MFTFFVVVMILAFCAAAPAVAESSKGPLVVEPDGADGPKVRIWLDSSLKRVYPTSEPGASQIISLIAPRGGQVSFQACLRNDRPKPLKVQCLVTGGEGLSITVRRVGFVPMRYGTSDTPASELDCGPGLIPDPLFNDQIADVGPYENGAFWVTVKASKDMKPGPQELNVRFNFHSFNWKPEAFTANNAKPADLKAGLTVSEFIVKPRKDFPVIHWWRGECIWDYYKTGMLEDEKWWSITKNYIDDMISHGTDVVYVPIFFGRRETFKRPCQLLKVTEPKPGKYEFNFSDVSKFVKMAKECGASSFEWSHFWIYWGARNPVRVYKWENGQAVMLWDPEIDGHGEVFHNFMRQFLPEFHKFLVNEGILDKSFFHVSDEPGEGESLENYKKARNFLHDNAPWMKGKVIDALSSIEYGRQNLTDHPIPIINTAQAYIDEKIPHWVYFCCQPRGTYLQRFLDTPLPKIRMSGWLFYKLGAQGFLHWGYNYWHALEQERMIDPFADATADLWPDIPSGDPFVVYPGADGKPIDSIRWEVFAESLQDYAILQTAGIKPDDPMLKDIKGYGEFPKSEKWIDDSLLRILAGAKQ